MGIQNVCEFRSLGRLAALALTAFVLAACASHPHTVYQPAPGSYFTVEVKRGDTATSVANRYQVNEEDVVVLNNIYDRDAKISQDSIRVPAYGHLREAGDERRGRGRNARIDSRPLPAPDKRNGQGQKFAKNGKDAKDGKEGKTADSDMGSRKPQGDRIEKKDDKRIASTEKIEQKPLPPPARQASAPESSRKFLWPVKGPVLSSFGSGNGLARNDGINIATTKGTPIRAADAGTVTYVGNELKGYGNLVLIRHDSGYVTAYAHSDTVTVQRGDRVTRGQIIAYAGATGDVTQPQLHFELRLNAKPVDPALYLASSS